MGPYVSRRGRGLAVTSLVAAMLLATFFPAASAAPSGPVIPPIQLTGPWPQYHGDAQHSGLSAVNTTRSAAHGKWSFFTGAATSRNSPVIGLDGTIYINSEETTFAITPDGKLKWMHQFHTTLHSTPALAKDGTIFISAQNGNLTALKSDGTNKWTVHPSSYIFSSPVVGPDNVVYFNSGTASSTLFAYSADGTQKWYAPLGNQSHSTPVLAKDGHIYVPCAENTVTAISTQGDFEWTKTYTSVPGYPVSAAIDEDGIIYFGTSSLFAIQPNGAVKWKFNAAGPSEVTCAFGPDGSIYFGSGDKLYALRSDGSLKWSFPAGDNIRSPAAVGAEGAIYFGCDDEKLYALDPDGAQKWTMKLGGPLRSSPAIGSDGTIYIASEGGTVYAIGPEFEPPSAPVGPGAATGPANVQLDWGAPASDGNSSVTGYIVYRSVASGPFSPIATLGLNLTYTDLNVTNGVLYTYRMAAKNAYGEGAKCPPVNATPVAPPSAPQGLAAKAADKKVTLSWDAPSDTGGSNITDYCVYRSLAGANFTLVVELGNVLNYTDTGLKNGKTYTYKVTAKNAAGEGVLFANVTVMLKAPAPANSPGFEAAILLAAIIGVAVLARRSARKE